MTPARDLYELVSGHEAPIVPRGLPLVTIVPGIVDAGRVCQITAQFVRDSLSPEPVLHFDSDEIFDYRAARPMGTFDSERFVLEQFPELSIALVSDEAGGSFLVMSGPEPDMRWKAMAAAVVTVCEMFEVSEHVSVRAMPSDVPHTRRIPLLAHANAIAAGPRDDSEVADSRSTDVPLSFAAYLETVLEDRGIASRGFVAQIPHYMVRMAFPAGALALLRRVSEALNLVLPLVELGDIVETTSRIFELDARDNEELWAHISALEAAFDQAESRVGEDPRVMLDLPTAQEIGDRMERFLAEEAEDSGNDPAS